MSSSKKDKGFNTGLSGLKQLKAKMADQAAAEQARPAPVVKKSPPPREEDDNSVFLRAMVGTQRIEPKSKRVAPTPRTAKPPPPDDALALAELQELVSGNKAFEVFESEEMHSGCAPGVNHQLLDRLQKGHFAHHQHLDLHGRSRDAAHAAVVRFVAEARRAGERCVLIITGRGKSSPGGLSVLREALPRWLCRAPAKAHVLAFCTARAVDGGPGAYYVLLRRSGVKPFGSGDLL